jgi:cation:H+ antiporter
VTAFYWSQTIRLAPMALLNMISSTVSQFTLLVGMIPLVYAVSALSGHIHIPDVQHGSLGLPIVPLDSPFLKGEVFLSWAMTLLGCAQIAKLRFTRFNAIVIFAIWILQFIAGLIKNLVGLSETQQHISLGIACLVFAAIEVAVHWREIQLRAAFRETMALMKRSADEATE